MITIEQLDVEFEVDGDDAATFERMFRQHIEKWQKGEKQRTDGAKRLTQTRKIGGHQGGEHE